jgi:hypothetical protein
MKIRAFCHTSGMEKSFLVDYMEEISTRDIEERGIAKWPGPAHRPAERYEETGLRKFVKEAFIATLLVWASYSWLGIGAAGVVGFFALYAIVVRMMN